MRSQPRMNLPDMSVTGMVNGSASYRLTVIPNSSEATGLLWLQRWHTRHSHVALQKQAVWASRTPRGRRWA